MVFLIGLCLLLIAAGAISRLEGVQGLVFGKKILQDEANEIVWYADEICILGGGNSRVVPLAKNVFEIEGDEGGMNLRGKNNIVGKETLCKISVEPDEEFFDYAYLWHETDANGEPYVKISSKPKN